MKNKRNIDDLKIKNLEVRPFIYKKPSVSEINIKIIILLFVQVLFLFFTKSYSAIAVVFASLLGASCAVVLNCFLKKTKIYTQLATIIQGLMIGLLLPENYSITSVFFISFLILFLAKYLFLTDVNSWINVVVVSVIFAWIIGQRYFPEFQLTQESLVFRNPSVALIQNNMNPIYSIDTFITNSLNNSIFSLLKVSVPEGIISFLWDTKSIIPAFRFNILTIISSIILFSDESFSILIPSVFLLVYSFLVRIFVPFMLGGSINQGDILLALSTSGTLFCAVFLIQWFGTTPITNIGKFVYAFVAGIIYFFVVGCGTSPIGMIFSVLIFNILNMVIRIFEEKKNNTYVNKTINVSLIKDIVK
jgi:Na+-translocating ferredoxin:NAD+ oxidoreductase subunit D